MTVRDRIEEVYADLSGQELRAAETLLAHADDLAVYSSAELAELSGVSRATLSRLYRRLGYESFAELRDEARTMHVLGVPLANAPGVAIGDHLGDEVANLRRMMTANEERIAPAVRLLVEAAHVVVVGHRNGYPVALHLREQLAQVRPGVRVLPLPGQSLAEDLVELDADDVLVLVGLRRRLEGFARLARWAQASPARVIAITDPTGRRHAAGADVWLECPIHMSGPFSSYASAMSLVALLSNSASTLMADAGDARVTAITNAYATLGELEGR